MKIKDLDWKLISTLIIFIILSICFSFFLGRNLSSNENALNLIANVFAVLSGFLLLVITMTSDTASISSGLSQTEKNNQKTRFNIRFKRYYLLFSLYFFVLLMIFIYYIICKKPNAIDSLILTYFRISLEYLIAFFTSLSFSLSLLIPILIRELYFEKIELSEKKDNHDD